MEDKIKCLNDMLAQSTNIVFFGGAGVSTESGIPDFRSSEGIYNKKFKYPPETVLTYTFFLRNPEDFYTFYRKNFLFPEAKPNPAHIKLAELEKTGRLRGIITQNVDGLHAKAGCKNVLELHGSVYRNYCMKCRHPAEFSEVYETTGVPKCKKCGGIIRPDVTFYEETIDERLLINSIGLVSQADMLIVGGTSLAVYPAAGMVNYYSGNKLVMINKSKTLIDNKMNLRLYGNIGEIMSQVSIPHD